MRDGQLLAGRLCTDLEDFDWVVEGDALGGAIERRKLVIVAIAMNVVGTAILLSHRQQAASRDQHEALEVITYHKMDVQRCVWAFVGRSGDVRSRSRGA